jgi:osmotically inducible protein OsmC
MKWNATADWRGTLELGTGKISTGAGGVSDVSIGRHVDRSGSPTTNAEELLAAAHAACFSMSLSELLDRAGFSSEEIHTIATVISEEFAEGSTVTGIQLTVVARVPGAKPADFIEAAVNAKTNCFLGRLLNTNVSLNAKLERLD